MKNMRDWLKQLPEKKQYIDFVTATMSVPILLTVMVTNISNLTHKNDTKAADHVTQQTPTPKVSEVIKIVPVAVNTTSNPTNETTPTVTATPSPIITTSKANTESTPTPKISCKKEVGPVSIISPAESEVINDNPVCIDISFNNQDYCGVTWSYRIDGGSWSEYMDKSICLYNLPTGTKKLELKIKSIGSADEVLLIRNFVYQAGGSPTVVPPTNTPEPTQSVSTSSATVTSNQTTL